MYQVGQKYFSIRANLTITIVTLLDSSVMVRDSKRHKRYNVSHSDMDRFIASGRLKPLDDFTPIKYLYNQPKIWLCDVDCVSL